MTHQTNDTAQDFDAKKFFTKAQRLYIEEPLQQLGFKKYNSSVIARLTAGGVFQFLDLQKSARRTKLYNQCSYKTIVLP